MSWQADATELIRKIDPGAPEAIYVLAYADVAALCPGLACGRCVAWTAPCLDLMLRDFLEESGRWVGRGFCMVAHIDQVSDKIQLLGTCLHEYAHYATWPCPTNAGDNELEAAELRAMIPAHWSNREIVLQVGNDATRWQGHGADFIRACCHLWRRSAALLPELEREYLNFGQQYYGPRFDEGRFYFALANKKEMPSGDSRSIREVLASDMPTRFLQTFGQAITQN